MTMPNGDKPAQRSLLRADRALMHEEGACLPLRSRHGQCRACAQACPVGALDVSLSGVALNEACMGCGRCVAACPTEALMLPELVPLLAVPPSEPAAAGQVVRMECRKVPASAHSGPTRVVPCLGAVRAGQLMAWAAQGADVLVVDRGWCETCEAGCGEGAAAEPAAHPADVALGAARLWLESVGASPLPRRVREPLPLTQRPAAIPPAVAPVEPLSRRSFFRAAVERSAGREKTQATPMGGDGRAAYPADQRQPSPERERQLRALQAIVGVRGGGVPGEFFAQLHVGSDCCDQRLCVALCPTAALTVVEDGGVARLQVSGERCIACGVCQRACPEGALQMQPFGGQPGIQTLITHRRIACPSCGDHYTVVDGATDGESTSLCPSCAKSQRFMDDARRQFFSGLN